MYKPTAAQRQLLQQLASGAQLWQSRDRRKGEVWWIRLPNAPEAQSAPANVARSLARRQLIEPTGLLYWRLTPAARAALGQHQPAAAVPNTA